MSKVQIELLDETAKLSRVDGQAWLESDSIVELDDWR
jgi:hypothetical protein